MPFMGASTINANFEVFLHFQEFFTETFYDSKILKFLDSCVVEMLDIDKFRLPLKIISSRTKRLFKHEKLRVADFFYPQLHKKKVERKTPKGVELKPLLHYSAARSTL